MEDQEAARLSGGHTCARKVRVSTDASSRTDCSAGRDCDAGNAVGDSGLQDRKQQRDRVSIPGGWADHPLVGRHAHATADASVWADCMQDGITT